MRAITYTPEALIGNQGITQAMIADGAINNVKVAAAAAIAASKLSGVKTTVIETIFGFLLGFIANALTRYFGGGAEASTEAINLFLMSQAGTIQNLRFKADANTLNGTSTITMRKNGVAQAITFTIAAGVLTGQDIANTFSVAAGDSVSIQIVTGGTTGGITSSVVSFEFVY